MIHSIMGLRPTGRREEIPESDIVGAELPTGWYLVLRNRNAIEDQTLERLSSVGEVVYCFVEDHVMVSTASGWKNKKSSWSVTHDSEKGRFHLDARGEVPSDFVPIRERLTAEQNADGGERSETDYIYDVPAELARELTGFRHDQDVPGTKGDIFQVLEPARGGFFRTLFGRKER